MKKKERRCRFRCVLEKGETIKGHMRRKHPEYYAKVQTWLNKTAYELRRLENEIKE